MRPVLNYEFVRDSLGALSLSSRPVLKTGSESPASASGAAKALGAHSGLLGGRCAIRWLFLIKSRTQKTMGPGQLICSHDRCQTTMGGRTFYYVWESKPEWRESEFVFLLRRRAKWATTNCDWFQNCSLLTSQIRIRVGEYDFSSSGEPLAHEERGVIKKVVHPKWVYFL